MSIDKCAISANVVDLCQSRSQMYERFCAEIAEHPKHTGPDRRWHFLWLVLRYVKTSTSLLGQPCGIFPEMCNVSPINLRVVVGGYSQTFINNGFAARIARQTQASANTTKGFDAIWITPNCTNDT